MPTVTVKDGGNTLSGYNFTAGGSGQSWTVQSDSGTNDAVSISRSGPVSISYSSRTPGQSFTITPTSSTGNYTVSLSQSVTTGGGKGGGSSTTVYTAQIQGNVAAVRLRDIVCSLISACGSIGVDQQYCRVATRRLPTVLCTSTD